MNSELSAWISKQNLLAPLPRQLDRELIQTLVEYPALRIERIVSTGQSSPVGFWYDQSEHEWVTLLSGAATLEFEDRSVELRPGDQYLIPAHCKHRVAWTDPEQTTVWLAVFWSTHK